MKKLLTMLVLSFVATLAANSQAPGIFNYQGVARNSVGNVLQNKNISLRLTIHDGTAAGPTVYSETRTVTTNPYGLFNVQVGSAGATGVTGTVAGVPWGVGNKFIQVEIDPNGGSSFINIGTAQLASVPYSLFATTAGDIVLPFDKSQADNGFLIRITNTGNTAASSAIEGVTNSTAGNAFAIRGTVSPTSPGGFSSGLRGVNNGTGGLGIGVYGSQAGSGWGVYGITPAGIGVNGASNSGIGTYGSSASGIGVFGTSSSNISGYFQNTNNANTLPTLAANTNGPGDGIQSLVSGNGKAGYFQITNNASPANAVESFTNSPAGAGVLGGHTATTGIAAGVRGESASQDANANGVFGIITSTTPGGFSTAVRGVNNGTGGLGIGVTGSQAGSGWGVYGNTPSGIGVYGLSTSGFGIYGQSTSGVSVYGVQPGNGTNSAGYFQNLNSANTTPTVVVTNNGTATADNINSINTGLGRGGYFEVQNAASVANAIEALTNGTGASWGIRATSTGTNGSGLFIVNNPTNAGNNIQSQTNGIGRAGLFRTTNVATTAATLEAQQSGLGSGIVVQLTNASNGARGIDVLQTGVGPGVFATSAGGNAVWGITSSISAAGVIGDNTFGEAVVGRNRGGNGVGAVVGRNDSSGYGVRGFNTKDGIGVLGQSGISGGTGVAGRFENVNAANTSSTVNVATNGIGSGITVQLNNASNGARGIDVLQTGVGPGVFATSAGGNAVWGITSSISAAGVIGDNTFGEAVVGRNRGGNGVGAVVGRNDSSGYGVRGFNTKDGIGVLGQAGISGGTGIGGRFENVNAANPTPVLQAAGNGTGVTLLVSNSNGGAIDLAVFQKGGVGNVARIDATGKGFFNGGTQNSGADVAEAFDVTGSSSNYEPGDVMVISTDKDRTVEKSAEAYSTLVVGVYATKPGVLLTEEGVDSNLEGKVPMGVIGVIPTKVCLEGGAIKRGDLLVTSSVPGVAMKADPAKLKVGQALGKALQDFNSNEIGKINVMVSVK